MLPSTRSAYQLTVHLPNAKYKVNSNPAFPPPRTYLNDESETDHYERMCVTMKSSRKSPQTSIPVSNHWVASRERLTSSGSTELCLTEIARGGSQIFFVCLVGVWQRNFEPAVCVCARYERLETDLEHIYRIYSNPTHDKHQWLLLQFIVLLMMDAKGVRNM